MKTFSGTKKSGLLRSNAGQALVELALSLTILLLLVCGIIEFGRALYIKNTLTNAARAAARAAVVRPCVDHSYAAGSLTTRDATDIVQQKLYDNVVNLPDCNLATATIDVIERSGTNALPNDTVTATVSLPFKPLISGVYDIFSSKTFPILNKNLTLVGSASMRFE